MLLVTAAIVVLGPTQVLFRTKFVSLHGQDGNLVLCDAHKDLSAVGHTYDQASDWSHQQGICVLKGREKRTDRLSDGQGHLNWFPTGFLRNGHVCVTNRQTTAARECSIRKSQVYLGSNMPVRDVTVSLHVDSDGSSSESFPREWWPNLDVDVMSDLNVKWYPLPNYHVGSGEFQTGRNSAIYPFGDEWFPVIGARTSMRCMILKRVIDDPILELGDIGFVSPEGWLVVRATRGKQDGLAWLFPIPGRVLKFGDEPPPAHPG